MQHYSRRYVPQGASGIGAWLKIMEFIAIICIPVNCGILYFTGTTKDQESSFARTLKKQNEDFWTAENIIVLCVLLEHAVILIKVLMQLFIDDVPRSVKVQERKRPTIE